MVRHVLPNILAPLIVLATVYLSRRSSPRRAQLPRPRHAAAGAVVGRHAAPRARTWSSAVAGDLPRPGDHDRRARLQLPRRRAARHPRSAARRRTSPTSPGEARTELPIVLDLLDPGWPGSPMARRRARRSAATSRSRRPDRRARADGVGAGRGSTRQAKLSSAPGSSTRIGTATHASGQPGRENTISQGVTTEVVGNCGWSYAPVTPASEPRHPAAGCTRLRSTSPPIPW